ncbi:hypothetical protein Q0M94_03380 [Deinococcus radiomollis]|uniref:hypothetical protein n=1 Tax=Deinococcus radiomollis TaxID=468916 RepID=UPI00389261FE
MSIIPAGVNIIDDRVRNIGREADIQAYLAEAEAKYVVQGMGGTCVGKRIIARDTFRRYIAGAKKVDGTYTLIRDDNGKLDAAALGVVDDVQMIEVASTAAASTTLTAAASGSAVFFPTDVGKSIVLLGKMGMVDVTGGSTTIRIAQHTLFTAGDVGQPITILGPGNVGTLLTTTISAVAADGRSATLAAAPASSHGLQADGTAPDASLRASWGGPGTGGVALDTTITAIAANGLSCTLAAPAVLTATNLHAEWGTDCTTALVAWVGLLGPQRPGIIFSNGTGTIWTRLALNLKDNTRIHIKDDLTLRIRPNAAERSDERSQTAMITGDTAFSLSSTTGMNRVKILGARLVLDVNFQYAPFAMLGGLRWFGAQKCELERARVIGASTPNAGETGFGIWLGATLGGPDCTANNLGDVETVNTPEWFQPDGLQVNQRTLSGIVFTSPTGGDGGRNGATISDARDPNNGYIASRCYANEIGKGKVSGGSHGYNLTNASRNIINRFEATNCAHRGVIMTPTCDENRFIFGTVKDSGSTGFHMAYNSNNNKAVAVIVDGVRNGVEGDGFKGYVLCSGNELISCHVINAGRHAYRWAHGSHHNKRTNCTALWTLGRGTAGSAAETAWKLTTGFIIQGSSQPQWDAGLQQNAFRFALGNVDSGCVATGYYQGFDLQADDVSVAGSVTTNVWLNCKAVGCAIGFPYDPTKDNAINGNTAINLDGSTCDTPFTAGLSNRFGRTLAALSLPDKGGPAAVAQTVFTTAYDGTQLPSAFPVGISISNVNGDATLPTTAKQGVLHTEKLGGTFDLEKFMVQSFYPANNNSAMASEIVVWRRKALVRNVVTDPSGWGPWYRLALATEIPTLPTPLVFTAAYDSTQLPSAFPVGLSLSNVNGDNTLPQGNQGALETMKLGATFDLEKFIVQLFYPANSGGLIAPWRRYAIVRNVGTDPSGWTAWQRLALASEVSTVAPSAAPATPITITIAGGSAGAITSQSFVAGSTSGNKRRYYGSYIYTPSVASAFSDHTITPAAGFTVEVHAPTGIQQNNGLPCPHALLSATSIRANANVGAVQVKFVFDLIG